LRPRLSPPSKAQVRQEGRARGCSTSIPASCRSSKPPRTPRGKVSRAPTVTHRVAGMTEADCLVDGFVERVAFVAHAMVVSSDGLPVATSKTIARVEAEHLAAVAAGLCSLT